MGMLSLKYTLHVSPPSNLIDRCNHFICHSPVLFSLPHFIFPMYIIWYIHNLKEPTRHQQLKSELLEQCWVLLVDGRVKCNGHLSQLPVHTVFHITLCLILQHSVYCIKVRVEMNMYVHNATNTTV
jgi:hypothetical protein